LVSIKTQIEVLGRRNEDSRERLKVIREKYFNFVILPCLEMFWPHKIKLFWHLLCTTRSKAEQHRYRMHCASHATRVRRSNKRHCFYDKRQRLQRTKCGRWTHIHIYIAPCPHLNIGWSHFYLVLSFYCLFIRCK
jgi:hypothetical protein